MMLGQLLKAWRSVHKCSRRKLAGIIGVDHVTLARVEEGHSNSITIENLNKIFVWITGTGGK